MTMPYSPSPALLAYVRRIGAEELSFKRYMVKEYQPGRGRHYYEEKAVIWIDEGKIKCNNEEYAPSDEEREAIELALINSDIPKSVGATTIFDLRPLLSEGGEIYEIWDRRTDTISMVQHAIRDRDNDKGYVAWSLWSDGQWRKMEPDGKLRFFKPRKRTRAARLMIHEGAKAALAAQRIVDDRIDHPWLEELQLYEHWGMLGGALAPHRSEYNEIDRGKFIEVVYACDNDEPGQRALQKVSRHYGKSLKGFRPDDKFPESWDIADAMPTESFKNNRWIGPCLKDMLVPATRATRVIPPKTPKGKKLIVLNEAFMNEWIHCVTPEVFIHVDWPNVIYTTQEFNNRVSPYSDVVDTARLIKQDDTKKGGVLKYSPSNKSGIYATAEAGRFINTHVSSPIKAEYGSDQPFLEFLDHLVPIEKDRNNTKKWIATLIARPDIKMLYGMLMISEAQGVGKGTLGEKILAPLVGINNTSFPSEQEIVDSSFNYWLAHKRLAVVHEIYAGHSAKAYNKLKSIITDKFINVNKKHMAMYQIENWMHVFACSNSMKALQLSSDDRRWFIPKVIEEKRSPGYWSELNEWLTDRGGLGIILSWAKEFVKVPGNVVMSGEDAPSSTLKKAVIDDNLPAPMAFVTDCIRQILHVMDQSNDNLFKQEKRKTWNGVNKYIVKPEDGVFFLDTDMQNLVMHRFYGGRRDEKLLKLQTIRKIASHEGMHCSNKFGDFRPWGRGDGREEELACLSSNFHMVCTNEDLSRKTPGEVFINKDHGHRPLDLYQIFGEL
jgi:hypothetical protein